MLRKFRIKLNEKEYIVEMEEIGGVPQPTVSAPAQVNVSAPLAPVAAEVAPTPAPVVATNNGPVDGLKVDSPMPGTILDVFVKAGDTVEENQVLLVLEAMKMENNIVAPKAGVVQAVYVSPNSAIDVGETMVVIA